MAGPRRPVQKSARTLPTPQGLAKQIRATDGCLQEGASVSASEPTTTGVRAGHLLQVGVGGGATGTSRTPMGWAGA